MLNKPVKNHIGQPLIVLPEVDSSNNYAIAQLNDGKAAHGTAYMALRQTQGKGQRNKQWYTGNGQNVALTIVLEPENLALHNAFMLHTYVCSAVHQYAESIQNGFSIKWPNDLYYNDRKAAGILIENLVRGEKWRNAVVGIGINVNDETLAALQPNAITLSEIVGQPLSIDTVAQSILAQLDENWASFVNDPTYYYKYYCNHLYKKNQQIAVRRQQRSFTTVLQTVSSNGHLICGENNEWEFAHGEVEWVT